MKKIAKYFISCLLAISIALTGIPGSAAVMEVKAESAASGTAGKAEYMESGFGLTDYTNVVRNCIPEDTGTCRTSFLGERQDGGYQAAIYHQGKIYIKNVSRDYQLESSREIGLELPLWGGLFMGKDYNYVICGNEYDKQAEGGGEAYRIIKYNKEFERIGSVSLNSDETCTATPFYWGTVSADECGDVLTVYTSRMRLDGRQSNIAIHINTSDMAVLDKGDMAGLPAMHQYDSFRQIVKYDEEEPVYVDALEEDRQSLVILQFGDVKEAVADHAEEYGMDEKSAELSGLAVSDTNYLVVGSYANQGSNNIFLSSVDKNSGRVVKQWLTDSSAFAAKYFHNPRIVKIMEDTFAVMWGGVTTQYILVDGRGSIISELKESPAPITDCEPIYVDGKILCLSVEDGMMAFHEMTDFSRNGVYKPGVEAVRSGDSWDGTADISWYDDSKAEFDLFTAQQLSGLAQLANSGNTFEGKKINLCQDIFLNDETYQYEWTPIAADEWGVAGNGNVFQGTFCGNNHVIYNLKTAYYGNGGLFGHIGDKGSVKCVDVSQGLFYSGGCIAYENEGMISFCNNYSYVSGWELSVVGGICNYNANLVYGCKNFGEVWGKSAGGIVGLNKIGASTVSQCANCGLAGGYGTAAGIVSTNYAWVSNCYNKGIVADRHWRNRDHARALCGIVYENLKDGTVENCYSAGVFSYVLDEGWPKRYGICRSNEGRKILNCYALPGGGQDNQGAETVSYEELASPSFVPKLDQQKNSILPVWKEDVGKINGGLPITAADESSFTGQCKIQPDLWVPGSENGIEVDLKDGIYQLGLKCYYNDSAPIVTIADTDIAEVSEGYEILPKKAGTTYIHIHFDETENNSGADYRIILKIKDKGENGQTGKKSQSIVGTRSYAKTYGDASFKLDAVLKKGNGDLSYVSSNTNVLKVSRTGKVKITGAGKASIMVTASETEEFKKCKYQVFVTITKAGQRMSGTGNYSKIAGSKPFCLDVKRTVGEGKISYRSTDLSVAAVSNNGMVTVKKPGNVVITVTSAATDNYKAYTFRIKLSVTAPKKGTVLTDPKTKAKYKVAKQGKSVEFSKPKDKNATKAVIPAAVTISGVKYNVTGIAANAFLGCKKLKSVSIGKNVESIGTKSFANCTSLGKLSIPSKVSKIGKQAFSGCGKLKDITINSAKLTSKSVGAKAFQGINAKAAIKVPKAKKAAYQKLLKSKGVGKKVKIK